MSQRGTAPSLSVAEAERMRDELAARGPDGSGLWLHENALLAHRRLAVRDLTNAGQQPMATPDGRFHIVYNGEIYNDQELRRELSAAVPGGFRSSCDTETVLHAFAVWGPDAFEKLRGMFALAIYDGHRHELHLARDPLGIKPLYYHIGAQELTFASEPKGVLAHPGIPRQPNMAMVSAYMSTVRSVLGRHSLFDGIYALRPGERLCFDTRNREITLANFHRPAPVEREGWSPERAEEAVREVLGDSASRHLSSDVPVCSFLSGGIDSSILCMLAAENEQVPELRTWCVGGVDGEVLGEDFPFAREMADQIGATHHEVDVGQTRFATDWPLMVESLGVPLSTPNEVAIHAVCRDLRAQGQVVALSGEGADELFAGYEHVMNHAAAHVVDPKDTRGGGRYQLESAAWVPLELKSHLLSSDIWQGIEEDALLIAIYDELYEDCVREVGPEGEPLDAHLRFLRRANLTGLLQRLDTASMLASVEGRTPFADRAVADLAERLPMPLKFDENGRGYGAENRAPGTAPVRGKMVLRRAYQEQLPASVCARRKLSFPLPFQGWIADHAEVLESSAFARTLFAPAMRAEIARDSERYFQLAWPMVNLALWGNYWWG